jgi:hypothetical protein
MNLKVPTETMNSPKSLAPKKSAVMFGTLRTVLAAGLLLLVAASIATPIVRRLTARSPDATANAAPPRPDALLVYYFRAKVRCPACRTLEACSREVVAERFSAAVARGRMQWRAVDYQTPGNEHFLTDYQLLTGGVVLVEFRDGRPNRWTALPETWNMTGDGRGLSKYLEDRIRGFEATSAQEHEP